MKNGLLVVMVFAVFSVTAFGQNIRDFWYEETNGEMTIKGYIGSVKDVVIPERINGLPVVAIGDNAFNVSSGARITSVVIPNLVRTIGDYAFAYNQLTSVIIPDYVKTIGIGAFSDNQLTSVVIPNSVEAIGYGAFSSNRLTNVVIGNSVKTISKGAFQNNQLKSVTIPNSVESISDLAFDEYVKITRQ